MSICTFSDGIPFTSRDLEYLEIINQQLNKDFKNEFSQNPSQDKVWFKVQKVALHSLETGFCKLDLEGGEVDYRHIPKKIMTVLDITVENTIKEDSIKEFSRKVIETIRNVPEELHTKFWVKNKYADSKFESKSFERFWKLIVPSLQSDERGLLKNDWRLLDLFRDENNLFLLFNCESEKIMENYSKFCEKASLRVEDDKKESYKLISRICYLLFNENSKIDKEEMTITFNISKSEMCDINFSLIENLNGVCDIMETDSNLKHILDLWRTGSTYNPRKRS